jgi:hypothetical protein
LIALKRARACLWLVKRIGDDDFDVDDDEGFGWGDATSRGARWWWWW